MPIISDQFPRLVYLANELRQPIPGSLVKYLPQGDVIQQIAQVGIVGTSMDGISQDQLEFMLKQGSGQGPAKEEEWRHIVSRLITGELIDQQETTKHEEFLHTMEFLSKFMVGASSIITTEEGRFTDDSADPIKKWMSGFGPFDEITEGFYQGLFIVMGPPGTGKTSHLLSLAESMRANNQASSIWLHQLEIPRRMFEYRMRPLVKRTKFLDGFDRIFYGMRPMAELIDAARKDPDPRRIIIHDSPDVLASSSEDARRFELESLFKDLVLLKGLCGAVFVASQPRRKDIRRVKMDSVAESWAKAWYADGIIGIQQMGTRGASCLMRAAVLKNRFGPAGLEMKYEYDMIDLTWKTDGHVKSASGWDDEPEGDAGEW